MHNLFPTVSLKEPGSKGAAQGSRHRVQGKNKKKNLFSPYALRLMMQSAKRRAQSKKLSMSKLPIFVRYAPCAMLYAI
jgi:hypothetical protein